MAEYDFIYGSKVIAQCQAQINICNIDKQDNRNEYLTLIGKDVDFFTYWCKLKNVVKCYISEPPATELCDDVSKYVGIEKDDKLITQKRAITWSQTVGKKGRIPGHGHGKQQIIFNALTFCIKDKGITFDPKKYTYSAT